MLSLFVRILEFTFGGTLKCVVLDYSVLLLPSQLTLTITKCLGQRASKGKGLRVARI